jgi:hypothetical protein
MTATNGGVDAAESRVWNSFFALAGAPDDQTAAAEADQALLDLDAVLSGQAAEHGDQSRG